MAVRLKILLLAALAAGIVAGPVRAQSPEEQLAAASGAFDARRYDDAARRLEAFLAAHPAHPRAGAAALALGMARSQLKQWTPAVAAYEKAIASKDKAVVPLAWFPLGEAAMNAGQYARAASALAEAVKTPLKPEQAESAWFLLGQAALEQERYPDAEKAFTRFLADFPKSANVPGALYGAGFAALRQGKTEPARAQLRQALDRFPAYGNRAEVQTLVARIDRQAGRTAEARAGLEAALASGTLSADLRAAAEDELTGILLETKEYAAAATRLKASLARVPTDDPQRPRMQLALGHALYNQKQYEAALAAYRDAAQAKDDAVAVDALLWGGNAGAQLGRRAEAADLYAKVLGRFPQSPQAEKAMTALLAQTDDPAQLAALLARAPADRRGAGTIRLARLHLDRKNYAAAAAPLADLLAAKPAPAVAAEANYLLGLAYEGQQKPAPAAAAFTESVRLAPAAAWSGDASTRAAWLYLDAQNPAAAETAARAALAGSAPAGTASAGESKVQARLALMQALLDQQKWDAALAESQPLLQGTPPAEVAAPALYTQAWAQEKRGKPELALSLWERLATAYPTHPYAAEALLAVGDARFGEKRYEEARARYAALLSNFAASPLAPEARYKLGTTLYSLERYPEAAAEWDRVAAAPDAGEYVPEALYWSGVALEKAGRNADAVQRLSRMAAKYPSHERTANAKVRLARLKALAGE